MPRSSSRPVAGDPGYTSAMVLRRALIRAIAVMYGSYRAQSQDQCNLVQLRHQLEPSEVNAQRVRDVISLLEEYGGFA